MQKFFSCHFIDVQFKNCLFSDRSVFDGCVFEGTLGYNNCIDGNAINVENIICSHEAEYEFERLLGRPSRKEVKHSFAEDVLYRALNKFKGNFGFSSIQVRHRINGLKPGNPYNKIVWDVLQTKGIVDKHHISNVSEGGMHVSEDDTVREDIIYFFENGIIRGSLKEVFDQLVKR